MWQGQGAEWEWARVQAAARGRKTECAEETPNLSHLPGATWGLQTGGSHEVQSLQLQAGLQARARQGGSRKLAYWLFCFPPPPPPPPEISLSGLKRLDPHFPDVAGAASRARSGCQGMFQVFLPGVSRWLRDSWGAKCKPYSNCKAGNSILLRRM